ncbi:Chemokine XC receptor 1 G-protein coupled receptor 5 Lymphotactin receptor XC chemokine receptor 1 [Channa argus]|uniref:Chemokine XC receptor 1 G-protein coupled receptor 5 Lymphotactin receptor XC chemokine receptor 1 n=1 Tax=Channa argus TaxID=215402 RepID=A0A6G1Q8E0_CHAAH|nr:Chemokine XC receptor 1 G-protein coupled receptor 5 Lymphotactin receptor XC chemokine receptor 1 [Channa argus]
MMENLTMAYEDDSMVYLCDRTFDFYTISSVFFILIFIFSVTGNCLILCVLVIYENLKNVTNIFILNVACSDLIFALTLPFWAVYYLHHWVFGDFTCKFMTAAHFIGLYSSVILLTAMTVDRFTTVVLQNWPNNRLKRQRCAKGACAAAWIISIAASLSNAISVKVETFQDNFTTCEASSEGSVVKLGNFLQVSLLFFLPLAIIVFCYSAIVKTVLQSSNRKWHRTLVVVFCIVAAFFICWGPYNMMILFSSFEPDECKAAERWEIAFRICELLAFSHCCLNPLLYLLSQKLRKHLAQFLHGKNMWRNIREKGNANGSFQNVTFIAQNSVVILEQNPRK